MASYSTAVDILYRDEWLVAAYKPAGMLVHRSKSDPREMRIAVQTLRDCLGQRVTGVDVVGTMPDSAAVSREAGCRVAALGWDAVRW